MSLTRKQKVVGVAVEQVGGYGTAFTVASAVLEHAPSKLVDALKWTEKAYRPNAATVGGALTIVAYEGALAVYQGAEFSLKAVAKRVSWRVAVGYGTGVGYNYLNSYFGRDPSEISLAENVAVGTVGTSLVDVGLREGLPRAGSALKSGANKAGRALHSCGTGLGNALSSCKSRFWPSEREQQQDLVNQYSSVPAGTNTHHLLNADGGSDVEIGTVRSASPRAK
jgi:hypothetical protein